MKIRLAQKLALACSLCLTVVVIVFTVTRASGLEWRDKLDVLWEIYFQIVAAEAGLILVSMTAFRALFVSRPSGQNQRSPPGYPFWMKSKVTLRKVLDPRRWISNYSKDRFGEKKQDAASDDCDNGLPSIPGGTMTGMRTFIAHQGDANTSNIGATNYPQSPELEEINWPLSPHGSVSHRREQHAFRHHHKSDMGQIVGPFQALCPHCGEAILMAIP